MEHIRKNNLPIFDVQVPGLGSHGDSFPQSSIILFHLSVSSRIIGGSVAHSYSLSCEVRTSFMTYKRRSSIRVYKSWHPIKCEQQG